MKAWMSLNFGKFATELRPLIDVRIKFLLNILILAGNEDMHESLDEFEFGPDTATDSRVICPCMSEKLMYKL